ncbi:sugar-phosphatase [Domibacillus robiginosus]|uniref:sugar-phosphatase n=1 Tax=Domibacillus robiginosus TaxID=1071054 RepID=UPI00067D4A6A|nr:sugar-phosphatase [Domibacillus robiginosus]
MYKLIAIDMDGTLLNDHHEVTDEVRNALDAARARGVKVVLCTGRPLAGVRRYLKDLRLEDEEDYVIAYNGAIVQNTNTNEVVFKQSLGYEDFRTLHDLSLTLDTPMHFFDAEYLYTTNKLISPYTVHEAFITKIPFQHTTVEEVPTDIAMPKVMYIDEPERLDRTIAAIPAQINDKYMMVKSAPFYLEILHREVSKGNAVKRLSEKLGIKREEVMTIGDNGNDLSMIQFAGCGVAMENAIPMVKEAADYQTKSNNEHGVAHVIRELVLV